MTSKISKARLVALEAIQNVEKNQAFTRQSLENTIRQNQLSVEDRKFATKLALGVSQTKITLEELIYDCVDKKSDIKQKVLIPLMISTYEIIYLEKEAHAAVDQGVELVGTVEPRAKGLANFVLHKIVNRKDKFPFGNVDEDVSAFCRMYSMPMWIYDYLKNDIGEEKTRMLVSSCNGQPPCYLFVNTIKSSVDEILEIFEKIGAEPKKINALCGVQLNNCIRISRSGYLRNPDIKKYLEDGKIIVADAASQGVCEFALMSYEKDTAPNSMLEVCAGTGNKAIMIQNIINQRCGKQANLTTIDNIEFKKNDLILRTNKCGINVDNAVVGDALKLDKYHLGKFDHVFVDAPCSGLGTLRRHPEIKWRLKCETIQKLAVQSLKILCESAKHVKNDGFLTYSTCTVTNVENIGVANNFLATDIGKHFVLCKFAYSGATHDCYQTQTVSGLNDVHFAVQFKRVG